MFFWWQYYLIHLFIYRTLRPHGIFQLRLELRSARHRCLLPINRDFIIFIIIIIIIIIITFRVVLSASLLRIPAPNVPYLVLVVPFLFLRFFAPHVFHVRQIRSVGRAPVRRDRVVSRGRATTTTTTTTTESASGGPFLLLRSPPPRASGARDDLEGGHIGTFGV